MKLRSITIENFKSIKGPLSINIKPITLLYGMNSAGKSSIIQALNYIKQIISSDSHLIEDGNDIDSIDLGSFKNIVYCHDVTLPIVFNMFIDVEKQENIDLANLLIEMSKKEKPIVNPTRFPQRIHALFENGEFLEYASKSIDTTLSLGVYPDKIMVKGFKAEDSQYIEMSDTFFVLKNINKINIKLVVKWNPDIQKAYIELYEMGVNGKKLLQVYRKAYHTEMADSLAWFYQDHAELSIYRHSLWPSDLDLSLKQTRNENLIDLQKLLEKLESEQPPKKSPQRKVGNPFGLDFDFMSSTQKIELIKRRIAELESGVESVSLDLDKDNQLPPDFREELSCEFSKIKLRTHNNYIGKNCLGSFNIEQKGVLPNHENLISFSTDLLQKKMRSHKGSKLFHNVDLEERFYINLLSALITTPIRFFRETFNFLHHIGPLRELPRRNYKTSKTQKESSWITGKAAYDLLLYPELSARYIHRINYWLSEKDCFNTGYKVDVKRYKKLDANGRIIELLRQSSITPDELNEIREAIGGIDQVEHTFNLVDIASKTKLEMKDVGTGISQIFPVVVGCLVLEESIITMEQPDLHIHPALQLVLGDLFIDSINADENNNTLIVENHSEHLMLRILRRIREKNEEDFVSPDDIAVYYVFKEKQETKVAYIPISEDGEFASSWPDGFFSERAGELFS